METVMGKALKKIIEDVNQTEDKFNKENYVKIERLRVLKQTVNNLYELYPNKNDKMRTYYYDCKRVKEAYCL